MRKLFYVILILTAVVAAGSCDRKGAQLDRTLDRADALMHDHPDSALAIMQSVDTTGLSRQHLARYALLMTSALDNNYLEPTNDSLVKIALDFYCGQQNSSEMRSIYLYAIVLLNTEAFNEALPYASLAYEMATEQKDWFYAGMSGRLLTDLYKLLNIFSEEKRYAIFSRDAFLRYEKEKEFDNKYSTWMESMIADAMIDNGEYQQSLNICNSVDKEAIKKSIALKHNILLTKANAYNRLNKPKQSIMIIDSLINDGYEMDSYNWNQLASYYYNAGDLINYRIALDSAHRHIKYDQDTLYLAYLDYILIDPVNAKQSLLALQNYNNEISKTTNRIIANSPLPLMNDSYKKRSEEYKQHIRKQKFRLYTSLAIAFAIIVCGAIFFARRIRLKKREIISLNEKKVGMDETIEKLTGELTALSTLISEEKLKNSASIENQNKILVSHLKDIDSLCSLVYTASGTETKDNRIIKNIRKSITSETSLTNIDEAIDALSDGFIDTIILNFPRMQRSRLRLVRYLFFGFSFETMMILFNYNPENRNNLDSAKSNLKRQITNKKDWVGTTEKTVLHKLNFK